MLREKYRFDVAVVDYMTFGKGYYPRGEFDLSKFPLEHITDKHGECILSLSHLAELPDDALYVLNSSVGLEYYAELLIRYGKQRVITYHGLLLADSDFSHTRLQYSYAFIETRINSILNNRDAYRQLLESMGDDESREVCAKYILYSLTADYRYAQIPTYADQYFSHRFLKLTDNEIVADCGAFIGDSLDEYLRHFRMFAKYYFFEPDERNIENARQTHKDPNIVWLSCGSYDRDGTISFDVSEPGISKISETGTETIRVAAIDSVASDATVIKMDIEGAEIAALQGAEHTIKANAPALAIAVYHKPTDLIEIWQQIRQLVPEYNFYLRSGFGLFNDLVLFATVN